MLTNVGITEGGDAGVDFRWIPWVSTGNPAVLISKNGPSMWDKVKRLIEESMPVNVILHFTITGYARTALEPHAPNVMRCANVFAEAVTHLGSARVVLRVDLVIPIPKGINRALNVYSTRPTPVHSMPPKKYDSEHGKIWVCPRHVGKGRSYGSLFSC